MMNAFKTKSDSYWEIGTQFLDEPTKCNSAAHCLYYAVFQAIFGWAETIGAWDDYKGKCCDENRKRDPKNNFATQHAVAEFIVQKRNGNRLKLFKKLKVARVTADYKSYSVPAVEIAAIKDSLKDIDNLRKLYLQA